MGTYFTGHITGFNDGEMGKVEDYSEVSILNNRESDISAMQIGNLRGKIYWKMILSYVWKKPHFRCL